MACLIYPVFIYFNIASEDIHVSKLVINVWIVKPATMVWPFVIGSLYWGTQANSNYNIALYRVNPLIDMSTCMNNFRSTKLVDKFIIIIKH